MTISRPIDIVRLEIGDTDVANALFTDDEIQYYITHRNDNFILAAADCCDALATRFAANIDFTTDTLSIKKFQRAEMMAKRADALRARSSGIEMVDEVKVDGYSQDIDGTSTELTVQGVDIEIPRYGPSWRDDYARQNGNEYVPPGGSGN